VVADRLSQAEGEWHPFHPARWARGCYPRPVEWQRAG